jgi:LysR family transcriptional regulator, regulator of abg operon
MREAHLRDFIAVIETGSVRAAAKRLNLTQGAISRNLTALERTFGVSLLLRSAHGVEPTEFGRAVLRRARVVDSELRKMQEDIDALSGGHAGVVSVGISSTAEALLLARAVTQVRKQLPNTLLSIAGGPFATTAAALREGRVDFAIGSVPPALEAADLEKERLLSTDLVIVARQGHPATGCTNLADLGLYEWVLGARITDARPAVESLFQERDLAQPRYAVQRDSSSALLHLLLETDMVAVASIPTVDTFCRYGMLSIIPIDVKFPPMVQYLITLAGRPLTSAAGAVAAEFRKASRKYRR